jgi:FtsP/CotA-like multicopper oxidase with cupredoxin domain
MRAWLAVMVPAAAAMCWVAAPRADAAAGEPALIVLNDNLEPAGSLRDGKLEIGIEVRRGIWHLLGPDRPGTEILAFADAGGPPSIPGPLIRIPVGTELHVSVTNPLDSTLVVHGLSRRRVEALDSLVVPPGTTREITFTADAVGTYYYWGAVYGEALGDRGFEDSQLTGAFVVDFARGSPPDRIMLIGAWTDTRMASGDPDLWCEFLVINGRPWPYTERLTYTMGDSIRWRLINASWAPHPMHRHGFYYQVDARGDLARDTLYWPAQRRMAVTELMLPGQTMALAWSPDRPGWWIFHCHLNWHVIANPGLGSERESTEDRIHHVLYGNPSHDPEHGVITGMGGLLMAMYIRPSEGWHPDMRARRQLRLYIQSDSTPADSVRRFGYVLADGARPPAEDSVRMPGPVIVLHRNEPTSIWVFNRTSEPTQVHWHGLEIDSYFDGVTGVSGYDGQPTPPIMPGDSFEVRVTPPRSGSFMYHTHVNDIRQQSHGRYGPLVVLEQGESWDPERDHVFLIGSDPNDEPILNGTANPGPLQLRAGEHHRFRLMNITTGGPGLEVWLLPDGAPSNGSRSPRTATTCLPGSASPRSRGSGRASARRTTSPWNCRWHRISPSRSGAQTGC